MEANEATQTHCYNPVVPAYPIWAYYVHGRQRRCQEEPVSLPSGRLEKKTRSSPHHVAQHRPTGSETTPPYAPRSSRFGSEPPSVEDDVDVWCYAILELHARNDDDDDGITGARGTSLFGRNVNTCFVLYNFTVSESLTVIVDVNAVVRQYCCNTETEDRVRMCQFMRVAWFNSM